MNGNRSNEPDLLSIIGDLEERKYCALPHAKSYARLLRAQLYRYVIDRDYVLELDEVACLLECVSEASVELPQHFLDALDEAVSESVDNLDPHKFGAGDDPETVLGDWLEQIEKIESMSSSSVDRSKKREIEEALVAFEMHLEARADDYRETDRFRVSPSSGGSGSLSSKGAEGFTDLELNNLFSSLRSKGG